MQAQDAELLQAVTQALQQNARYEQIHEQTKVVCFLPVRAAAAR